MLTCNQFSELLDGYLSGELSAHETLLMTEHARSCPSCRAEMEFVRSVYDTMHTLPKIPVPANFIESLNQRLDAEEFKQPQPKIVAFPRTKQILSGLKKYSALAACILLLALTKLDIADLASPIQTDEMFSLKETISTPIATPKPAAATDFVLPTAQPVQASATQAPVTVKKNTASVSPQAKKTVVSTPKPTTVPRQTQASQTTPDTVQTNSLPEITPGPDIGISTANQIQATPLPAKVGTIHEQLPENDPKKDAKPQVASLVEKNYQVAQIDVQNLNSRSVTDEFSLIPYIPEPVIASNQVVSEKKIHNDSVEAKLKAKDTNETALRTARSGMVCVSQKDLGTVAAMLSKYQYKDKDDFYFLTPDNFTAFLSEMNQEGIAYKRYAIVNENENVAFKLVTA